MLATKESRWLCLLAAKVQNENVKTYILNKILILIPVLIY
jgi:hypothetical protein